MALSELILPPPKFENPMAVLWSPRLLVIEDDPDPLPCLSRAARRIDPDLVVDWAQDADAARDALRSMRYDAILADFMLADSENGLVVLDEYRDAGGEGQVAVMSALPIDPPDDEMLFLAKPFTVDSCATFLVHLLEPALMRRHVDPEDDS